MTPLEQGVLDGLYYQATGLMWVDEKDSNHPIKVLNESAVHEFMQRAFDLGRREQAERGYAWLAEKFSFKCGESPFSCECGICESPHTDDLMRDFKEAFISVAPSEGKE